MGIRYVTLSAIEKVAESFWLRIGFDPLGEMNSSDVSIHRTLTPPRAILLSVFLCLFFRSTSMAFARVCFAVEALDVP